MEHWSINTGVKNTFGVVDYILFVGTMLISVAIGAFYAVKDNKNVTSKNYLLAERRMNIVPVTLSILVTSFSATTLLGMPAEVYTYNTMIWWMCISAFIGLIFTVVTFVPFFYQLNVTSMYEYLEMRFHKHVRVFGSVMFIIKALMYMSFVLYVPALALNAATDINLWGSVITVGAVVTIYTTIGGMKAVLWADSFQSVVIFGGLLGVVVQGLNVTGGIDVVWKTAIDRSRIHFTDFNPDPTIRHSFWSLIVGGGILWFSIFASQSQMQRVMACRTMRQAQLSMLLSAPMLIIVMSLCSLLGIIILTFYKDCHPVAFNNLISRNDQLLPLFTMDTLGNVPGVPGVFISCIFSGSLSTLSSTLNSMGAVVPRDLIQPLCCTRLSDSASTLLSKVVVFVCGFGTIMLAFLVSQFGGLLQATYTVASITSGPIFGMFLLGMFFRRANKWGAMVGSVTSLAVMTWIGMSAFMARAGRPIPSPVNTDGCNWNVTMTSHLQSANQTSTLFVGNSTDVAKPAVNQSNDVFWLYRISYMWYLALSVLIQLAIGLIVSIVTSWDKPVDVHPALIFKLSPCGWSSKYRKERETYHKIQLNEEEDVNGGELKHKAQREPEGQQYQISDDSFVHLTHVGEQYAY